MILSQRQKQILFEKPSPRELLLNFKMAGTTEIAKNMADKCGRCGKTVYPTEKVSAISKAWHKACFKCTTCNATIQLGTEQAHDGMPYCKRCHGANFGIGGYGYGGSGGSLSSHKWNTEVHTAPTGAPAKEGRHCGKCGAVSASDGKFCASCGEML
eukprot:TRINITY_DN927_c0_g1_i1.p1 TRINITY_DN927_c0_g1~~TRINITY_DN927_c0_g1_i1.p1  ORF type:complete len:156 (-),score=22.82 TRINITY_DN927_c0_g1_i1:234-701(-)